MLHKRNGELWFSCDECGDETATHDANQFDAAVAALKGDGWQVSRDKHGHWEHRCGGCTVEGNRLAAAKRLFGK